MEKEKFFQPGKAAVTGAPYSQPGEIDDPIVDDGPGIGALNTSRKAIQQISSGNRLHLTGTAVHSAAHPETQHHRYPTRLQTKPR